MIRPVTVLEVSYHLDTACRCLKSFWSFLEVLMLLWGQTSNCVCMKWTKEKRTYAIRRILYGRRSEDQINNRSNPLQVHMTSTVRQNDKLHPSSSPSTIIT